MALPSVDTNWIAVVVVAVVSFIIGMLWYSPLLFGNAWMKLMGLSKKKIAKEKSKGMGKIMVVALIATIVTSFVVSWFVKALGAGGFGEGVVVGFWLWLGISAPLLLNSVLWEGKKFNLYLINVTHALVNLLVIGGILAVWR